MLTSVISAVWREGYRLFIQLTELITQVIRKGLYFLQHVLLFFNYVYKYTVTQMTNYMVMDVLKTYGNC